MKTLRRRRLDRILFAALLALATSGLGLMFYQEGVKPEFAGYVLGFAFTGAAIYVSLPFVTGSDYTSTSHRIISTALLVTAVAFACPFAAAFTPLENRLSENEAWHLLGLLVISGGLCLFVLAPLSLAFYLHWLLRASQHARTEMPSHDTL